jgi:REP element-mobilizing transposase RayT
MYDKPLASFITFTTYGSWLHGDERGSIINENGYAKLLQKHAGLQRYHKNNLSYPPVKLNMSQRKIVLDSIMEVCNIRKYTLFAVHIRSNHIHILVDADKAEVILDFKRWATRKLRSTGHKLQKVWTEGGSKKYIFKECQVYEKADYIINQQGEMMAYYVNPKLSLQIKAVRGNSLEWSANKSPAT